MHRCTGVSRQQFLAKVATWKRVFVALNLVLCLLSLGCLIAAALYASLLGLNTGAPPVLGCSSLLFLFTLVGLIAYCRLERDLATDEDGKETVAQTLLIVHFWGTALLALVLLVVGILQLRDAGGESAAISLSALAARFPGDFQSVASALGVSPAPNTGAVAKAQSVATTFAWVYGVVPTVIFVVLLPTSIATAQIVSTYEIVQSLLQIVAVLCVALGLTFAWLASVLNSIA